jgi:thiamine-monophosphate kinase
MKLSKIGERGLIKIFREKCTLTSPHILKGIGDDAAVVKIKNTNKKMLVTSDMLIEGVHFDLSFITFYQLGYKFLAVNISDIHAMGGWPEYFIVCLGIPDTFKVSNIKELYSGITELADKFNISVIGGDTCASREGLVLSGTLIGTAKKIVTRSGARAGDGIFVTDTLGDSAMGLTLLKQRNRRIYRFTSTTSHLKLMKKHLMPEPVPLRDISKITSMIDVSDGLLVDLSHICDESKVGAVLYTDKIPLSKELVAISRQMGYDPLEFALKGGEDYALLFTAPSELKTSAFRIGDIVKKERIILDAKGNKRILKPEGYEHFKHR